MENNIPTIKFPRPETAKIHKKLDLFAQEKIIKPWTGSTLVGSLFYSYLFHKYKNNCFMLYKIPGAAFYEKTGMIMYLGNKAHRATWPAVSNYALDIFRCISRNTSEAFVIPLSLRFSRSGHANLLIYRKKGNVIEHFEPHGAYYGEMRNNIPVENNETNKAINAKLDELIKQLNIHLIKDSKPEVKLVRSNTVCPNLQGLQALESMSTMKKLIIEGGGYCAVWSMFFTEMVMKNPSISSPELMRIILGYKSDGSLNMSKDYFRKIIRGYVHVIYERIEKYYSFIIGIQKLTVDEIIRFEYIRNKESIEMYDSYEAILHINNFILNNPSSNKEEYIKFVRTENSFSSAQKAKIISILQKVDESVLNPSITPSSSSPTTKKESSRSPTPKKASSRSPTPIVPPNITRRCPNGFRKDPKTKNCVKKPDTNIATKPTVQIVAQNKRCPPGTRKRKLLKNEPPETIRPCLQYTK